MADNYLQSCLVAVYQHWYCLLTLLVVHIALLEALASGLPAPCSQSSNNKIIKQQQQSSTRIIRLVSNNAMLDPSQTCSMHL